MAPGQERRSAIMGFPASTHRWSALSGVSFALLLLAAVALLGFDYPTYDDRGEVFAAYYADNADEIKLSTFASALAAASLAWFAGFLRWFLNGAEVAARGFARVTDIGFAAAVAAVGASLAAIAAQATATVAQGTVEAGVIRALDLMGDYTLVAAGLLLGIWLLAAFYVIRVTGIVAAWVAWLAGAGAGLGILQSTIYLAPQDDDGVLGMLGLSFTAVLIAWVTVVSLTLVRRVDGGARS